MTSGLTSVSPNTFDFYVLALEWQPAWARDACPSGRRPNAGLVEKLSGDATGSYARTSLSLHGLWPDYDRGSMHAADGFGWPQWCDTCQGDASAASCLDYGSACQEHTAELSQVHARHGGARLQPDGRAALAALRARGGVGHARRARVGEARLVLRLPRRPERLLCRSGGGARARDRGLRRRARRAGHDRVEGKAG